MIRSLSKVTAILITFYLHASAAILPFPSPLPAVNASYDSVLLNTWNGIKKRMIDPYEVPLVHRPRSEEPHDAVSEGVGYGMLVALFCNDQTCFNKIWDAGEQHMWDDEAKCYNWRVNREGTVIGTGAASDAEQDIALALIFADALVKKGTWQSHSSPRGVDYAARAQSIINSIWNSLVEDGRYLRPGTNWGGRSFLNPGYFAPAFYRVFDEYEQEDHNWSSVIDQCYQSIEASPGYDYGFVPDWMQPDGNYAGGDQLGYNAYAEGKAMYKDGIRVLWRIATDYIWYGEPRAKQFLDNALAFIQTPDRANFFQMDGSVVVDSFTLGNGVTRPRAEHSPLTVGMWAAGVMGAGGPEAAEPFSTELLSFYEPGADYWGRSSDPDGEDTLHNEMYFEQFLSWFGAAQISGIFTNLVEDFKDSNPEIAAALIDTPLIDPLDINADFNPLRINARFNKSVRWTVELKHRDSADVSVQFAGSGTEASIKWSGSSASGKCMPQGAYRVIISARGMKQSYSRLVWLGRARDLRMGSRLIIDDFIDGDLRPYFGSGWGSYTEQSDGKNGATTIKRLEVVTEGESSELHWGFRLDGSQQIGFNPYAALEWTSVSPAIDSTFTLSGLDTIVFTARANSPVHLSLQLITSDIGDYTYFEDSVTVDTESREYHCAVNDFRQRLGGSGHTLDLSKCTAIRFQIQDVDGTENELIMESILFAGSLASIYTSPPPYIPAEPGISVSRGRTAVSGVARMIRTPRNISFELPAAEKSASLRIVSINGRTVATAMASNERYLSWDYRDRNGAVVAPGCYVAVVHYGAKVFRTLVQHLPQR